MGGGAAGGAGRAGCSTGSDPLVGWTAGGRSASTGGGPTRGGPISGGSISGGSSSEGTAGGGSTRGGSTNGGAVGGGPAGGMGAERGGADARGGRLRRGVLPVPVPEVDLSCPERADASVPDGRGGRSASGWARGATAEGRPARRPRPLRGRPPSVTSGVAARSDVMSVSVALSAPGSSADVASSKWNASLCHASSAGWAGSGSVRRRWRRRPVRAWGSRSASSTPTVTSIPYGSSGSDARWLREAADGRRAPMRETGRASPSSPCGACGTSLTRRRPPGSLMVS